MNDMYMSEYNKNEYLHIFKIFIIFIRPETLKRVSKGERDKERGEEKVTQREGE